MLALLKKRIKIPKIASKNEVELFFKKVGLKDLIHKSKSTNLNVNQMISKTPYKPELDDLYRIYKYITLNKRTTVLEFGSGWSTLLMCMALNENKKKYKSKINKLRRNNPFELFTVDNEKKFLSLTKKKINKYLGNKSKKINYIFSDVEMTSYVGNYSTQYKKMPLCNPDFIYLDGPDQFKVKKKNINFTTAHKDMMPMSCDILKIEYFLTPGTIIVSDGRSANAQFLIDNFKRKWLHYYDKKSDQHVFYLDAPALGALNRAQLKFYK